MSERILIINPNSNAAVTDAIDASLTPLRMSNQITIECMTMHDGPLGIESQRDVEEVAPNICRVIEEVASDTAAFVIACYSDPGLYAAREATAKPVFGIAQSALAMASVLGNKAGIISINASAVNRHWAYARSSQLDERIAADLPVDLSVAELQNSELASERMSATGRELRDRFGADVIVLGCAGMAQYREPLESSLNLPIIDPTQAAVAAAIAAVKLGYRTLPR